MRYLANDKYNSTLTSGWTASPPDTNASVGSVPSLVPTIVVMGRGTDLETKFSVTGTSGGNTLTGLNILSGGNVDIPQGTSVECLNNEEFINQYEDAVFDQQGVQNLLYAADGGSTDAYAISLGSDPGSLANLIGVPIIFLANTLNTGPATLAVNGLTAKTIKKNKDVDLVTGDIKAGQLIEVVYDGTNFQLLSAFSSLVDFSTAQTLTNKKITKRVLSATSYTTDTGTSLNCDNLDWFIVTAQAGALKLNNPSGTPTDGQLLGVAVTGTAARALTYDTQFEASTTALPSTTVTTARLNMLFCWRADTSKWIILAAV